MSDQKLAHAYDQAMEKIVELEADIERLRREETEYMERCSEQHEWEENERVRLQAEIERLRAAFCVGTLEETARRMERVSMSHEELDIAIERARRVLEAKG